MSDCYYLDAAGSKQGPVPEAEVRRMVSSGRLSANTLVWRSGLPAWKSYEEVFGPQPVAAAPPAKHWTVGRITKLVFAAWVVAAAIFWIAGQGKVSVAQDPAPPHRETVAQRPDGQAMSAAGTTLGTSRDALLASFPKAKWAGAELMEDLKGKGDWFGRAEESYEIPTRVAGFEGKATVFVVGGKVVLIKVMAPCDVWDGVINGYRATYGQPTLTTEADASALLHSSCGPPNLKVFWDLTNASIQALRIWSGNSSGFQIMLPDIRERIAAASQAERQKREDEATSAAPIKL